jgi:hypothetical protein
VGFGVGVGGLGVRVGNNGGVLVGARVGVGSGAGLIMLARPVQRQKSKSELPSSIAIFKKLDCLMNHCIGDPPHPFVSFSGILSFCSTLCGGSADFSRIGSTTAAVLRLNIASISARAFLAS